MRDNRVNIAVSYEITGHIHPLFYYLGRRGLEACLHLVEYL
jgi:hypothetical protein